jgi:hypothetical protein
MKVSLDKENIPSGTACFALLFSLTIRLQQLRLIASRIGQA